MKTNQANECNLDTPATLAKYFQCTPQTVLNWLHDGIIPAEINIGRVIRFDKAKVIDALKKKGQHP